MASPIIEKAFQGKLDEMRTEIHKGLQERVSQTLDAIKVEIAQNYFGQTNSKVNESMKDKDSDCDDDMDDDDSDDDKDDKKKKVDEDNPKFREAFEKKANADHKEKIKNQKRSMSYLRKSQQNEELDEEVPEVSEELAARLEASQDFSTRVGTSVNELSKKTLGSYVKKASRDAVDNISATRYHQRQAAKTTSPSKAQSHMKRASDLWRKSINSTHLKAKLLIISLP